MEETENPHHDTVRIINGEINVKMNCSLCNEPEYITRDSWERYYSDGDNEFACKDCQYLIIP